MCSKYVGLKFHVGVTNCNGWVPVLQLKYKTSTLQGIQKFVYRYGDTMTNIVVVQFSDYVQTSKDKRFNLTCLFRGPGEAVVTSSYIGAGLVIHKRL